MKNRIIEGSPRVYGLGFKVTMILTVTHLKGALLIISTALWVL